MATFKRYQRVIPAIEQVNLFLTRTGRKVFTPQEINQWLTENRMSWGFAQTTPIYKLVERLINHQLIRAVEIQFPENKKLLRYLFGNASVYEIAVSFHSKSYISHFSAMHLLGLTTQVPKTIYVTNELSKKIESNNDLSQSAIDLAFAKPQRRAVNIAVYEDYQIVLLNGKYSGRAGVTTQLDPDTGYSYTGLERTLIDAAVRPNYSGGTFMVLNAYRQALTQDVSINKLLALLNNLSFIYPYQQAIGFYLERAGFQGKQLNALRDKISSFDFYLDYQLVNPAYSKEWKLYYPKEM
jgi:predicted transcriptional regulator of viral defense system